jgi:hypothetical protein
MSVDLIAAIEHRLSAAELMKLPGLIDQLSEELKAIRFSQGDPYNMQSKSCRWPGNGEMSEQLLAQIWYDWESGTQFSGDRIFDNQLDCMAGTIEVWKNTLLICQFPEHKYANLLDPVRARMILESNRCIARVLHADKILYFPDSAFPTSVLLDKAQEGLTIAELIEHGEKEFGPVPQEIADGMQNMFFTDRLQELEGALREWDFADEKFWKYNRKTGTYERA